MNKELIATERKFQLLNDMREFFSREMCQLAYERLDELFSICSSGEEVFRLLVDHCNFQIEKDPIEAQNLSRVVNGYIRNERGQSKTKEFVAAHKEHQKSRKNVQKEIN